VQDLTGGGVEVFDVATELDRLSAAARLSDLGGPSGVFRIVQAGDHARDRVRIGGECGQDGDLLSLVG
jgi:hypothetical protein